MADYEQNWFRIPISELHLNAWSRPSLYIWRHNVRAGVYFNHSFLGGTTQTPPIEQLNISWNHPLLIDITHSIHAPPAQGPSADYIYIKVDSGPGGTTLSPLVFGDRPALEGIYNKRHFLQIEVSFWLFILCCLLSVLGIWLWIQRRDEQLYLEFSALAAFSALTTSFFFLDFVPIGMQAWITLHHAGSAWVLLLMIRFSLDALNLNWPRLKRGMSYGVLAITVGYLLLPPYYLQPVGYSVSLLLTLAGTLLGIYIISLTVRAPTSTRLWFSVAYICLILLQCHDIYYAFLSPPEVHIVASNWMQLSSPLLAIAFFAHLIHRFTNALNVSESLNRTLEARVAATNQELKLSYEKNREFELDNRANEERSKIYRSLHDDLGSQLISIVHTAEDDKQRGLARRALESLRESIYKASNPALSFSQCIRQIHEEAELRLTSAGKHYALVSTSNFEFDLDPGTAYNLTRIVREAISNILQHSNCERVELSLQDAENKIEITLIDNGTGRVVENLQSGGLANIRYRAEQIGAELAWRDVTVGNCLSITLQAPA
tara:strand:+ start:9902 stop:11542 length:1641 start_codon:yes stop_codon:yes gene_type:complete